MSDPSWRLHPPPRERYRLVRDVGGGLGKIVAEGLPNLEGVIRVADRQARETGDAHAVVNERSGATEHEALPPGWDKPA